MLRGTLALLIRSLRFDARRRRAHTFRLFSIAFVFIMLVGSHILGAFVGAPGLRFFQAICFLSFALVTLAGCGYFATAVTEEKEEGTLGLLKLADLSALSILLGKSTPRLVTALMIFLGQFPFALLAITLGGVTVHQVAAAYTALAAYLFAIANMGLVLSVVCSRGGLAALLLMLILLFLLGGPAFITALNTELIAEKLLAPDALWVRISDPVVAQLTRISVVQRLTVILETGFNEATVSPQVVVSLLAGAACFALAWTVFDRYTEYLEERRPERGLVPRATARRRFLVQRPWRHPLLWKDYQFVAGGPWLSVLKLVGYPALIALLYWRRKWLRDASGFDFAHASRLCIIVIALAELVVSATRIFHQERMQGTLSTLLMLPRSPWQIASAKMLGCLVGSLPTWMAFAALYSFMPAAYRPLQVSLLKPEAAASIVGLVVLLHLTAFYSLVVRWGALPLAVATFLIAGTLIVPVLSVAAAAIRSQYHEEYAQLGPILYTGGVLTALLQFGIILRMQHAAAYD